MPKLLCRTHPVAAEALAIMRHKDTPPREFSWQLNRLSLLLAAEATRDLRQTPTVVPTPFGSCNSRVVAGVHAIVPILRSGLGMVEAHRLMLPDSTLVWDVLIQRDEKTAQPIFQATRVPEPEDMPVIERAFVLDPALATAGTACYTATHLKDRGVENISFVGVLGCPTGLERLQNEHPDIDIFLGEIDPELDARAFLQPGFGDGGDRQRPTVPWTHLSLAQRLAVTA